MTKQNYLLSFFLFSIVSLLSNHDYAQTITVTGHKYKVVKAVSLHPEVTYYQVNKKTAKGESLVNYIKLGKTYSKTVFSETELKEFYKTGMLSSLGKISTIAIPSNKDKAKISYINKGYKKVFFAVDSNSVNCWEYSGSLANLFEPQTVNHGHGPSRADKLKECRTLSNSKYTACMVGVTDSNSPAGQACESTWEQNMGICEVNYGLAHGTTYLLPTINLTVRL